MCDACRGGMITRNARWPGSSWIGMTSLMVVHEDLHPVGLLPSLAPPVGKLGQGYLVGMVAE